MGLVLLLSVTYLGTIALLNRLVVEPGRLSNVWDAEETERLVAGLATVIVVLFYNPLRRSLGGLIDRFILRGRVDHREALRDFTRQVRLIQTLDPLLDLLMELLHKTIAPRFCAVLLPPRPSKPLVAVRHVGIDSMDIGAIPPDDPLLARALGFGEALFLDNLVHGSTAWRAWRQLDVELIVPLLVGEDLTGLLVLGPKPLGRSYNRTDLWMLNTLADQSAVAIETARLYDQSLRRTAEITALFEMGTAVSASLEEDEVLAATARQLVNRLEVDGCIISNWDQGRDCLVTLVSSFAQEQPLGTRTPLNNHPARPVLQGKLPQAVTAKSSAQARKLPLIANHQMRAVLMLPLIARDDVLGLIELYSSASRQEFTPRDIQLGQTLANQVAAAIANARLYEEAKRRAEELSTLVEIGAIVGTILDVEGALKLISQEMVHVLHAVGCRVSSWDRERDQIISWLDYHLPDVPWVPGPLGTIYPLDRRPDFALALRERCAVCTTVPLSNRSFGQPLGSKDVQTVLILPLIARDEAIGVIELGAENPGRVFSEWEISLAQTLVNQAAIAIENARTYEDQRLAARNLERKVEARTAELDAAMQALLVESSKREAILEGVADGVLFADADGEITVFNAMAEQLLGIRREQALGNSIEGLVAHMNLPNEAWKEIPQRWAELCARPYEIDFIEERYQVGESTFSIRLSPVTRDYQFVGVVAVLRDISQDVELNRAKSAFVSSVSHELRIPMTSIKGYTDLLLMESTGPLNEKQTEFLKIIQDNSGRLTTLVNDLLDISRLETGRMELKLAKVDLSRVTGDVMTALRPGADGKKQALTNEIPDTLPPVLADGDRVAQVLINLIGNAIAYTPDEGHIRVLGRLLDSYVQVDVIDDGIGIALEEQGKIWERFYRSERPEVREQTGTGLGLPIVRSLVELQGGKVWVESQPGDGSTFSLTLPIAFDDEEAS
jgi:PAS domain S-box-containing protein